MMQFAGAHMMPSHGGYPGSMHSQHIRGGMYNQPRHPMYFHQQQQRMMMHGGGGGGGQRPSMHHMQRPPFPEVNNWQLISSVSTM